MTYKYRYNRTLLPFSQSNRHHQTKAENLLWLKLRNRQLGRFKFRRQYPILNYIIDFYCLEKKVAIELDGSQHMKNQSYDKKRSELLQKQGIRVLRFWDNEVLQNTNQVLEKILLYLQNLE